MKTWVVLLFSCSPAAAAFRVAPVPAFVPGVAPVAFSVAGALAAPRVASPFPTLSLAAPSLLPSLRPTLALPAPSAPLGMAASPAAMAIAASRPDGARAKSQAPETLVGILSERVESLAKASAPGAAPNASRLELDRLFSGQAKVPNAVAEPRIVNDEGITIFGRPPAYYLEVKRLAEKFKGKLDIGESLDVMDDSYGDAWAKLAGVEALAKNRRIEDHNTHLEGTLLWVDGVLQDHGRRIAVNTQRVYFHKSKNPRSEIAEGLRRTEGYIKEALEHFKPGGRAEKALGSLDEVVLVFDTRGYAEIKAALKARAQQVEKETGGRVRFQYLDELTTMPKDAQETRARLNALVKRYGNLEGLGKIIEGVVYGRYVGMLLELKTVEYYLDRGWEVLQSGRELFDDQGMYITELDTVVRDPATGRTAVVEAKSARVPIPFEDALKEKVIRKLDTYKTNRALLERSIGHPIDAIVFSFDIGRNQGLRPYLEARAKELSSRYGFTVSFLFLSSTPEGTAPNGRGTQAHGRSSRRR